MVLTCADQSTIRPLPGYTGSCLRLDDHDNKTCAGNEISASTLIAREFREQEWISLTNDWCIFK